MVRHQKINRNYCVLVLFVITIMRLPISAQLVGDFCPLKVGNSWVYQSTGGQFSTSMSQIYKNFRRIEIDSVSKISDTNIYSGEIDDSDFCCTASPDQIDTRINWRVTKFKFTVKESGDGALNLNINNHDSLLFRNKEIVELLFKNHLYPDSDIIEDVVYSPFPPEPNIATNYKIQKNIGLTYFMILRGNYLYPDKSILIEFNGNSFNQNNSAVRVPMKMGASLIGIFSNRDILGRLGTKTVLHKWFK